MTRYVDARKRHERRRTTRRGEINRREQVCTCGHRHDAHFVTDRQCSRCTVCTGFTPQESSTS